MQRQDAKSLALFQAVHAKISQSPDLRFYLHDARQWAALVFAERRYDIYLNEWVEMLDDALVSDKGLAALYGLMLSPEQHAIDMRSSSPFAGVLTPAERTNVLVAFQQKWLA